MLEKSSNKGPEDPADLRTLPLFAECGQEVLAPMFAALRPVRMRARSTLVIGNAARGQVAFLWSGRVRLTMVSPGSAAVTLYTAEPGAVLGLPAALLNFDASQGARLQCDQAALLLTAPIAALMDAARACPNLCDAIMRMLAAQSIDFAARVYELAALDVRARLQAELLRLARRGAWQDGVLIVTDAPTQAALGAQIGAAREAVTRHLRDLTQEGLIVFKRGAIEFPDLRRLKALDQAAAGRAFWSGAASNDT